MRLRIGDSIEDTYSRTESTEGRGFALPTPKQVNPAIREFFYRLWSIISGYFFNLWSVISGDTNAFIVFGIQGVTSINQH